MMASTFAIITERSFENYVFEFSKVLVQFSSVSYYTPPFNLLTIPYRVAVGLTSLVSKTRMLYDISVMAVVPNIDRVKKIVDGLALGLEQMHDVGDRTERSDKRQGKPNNSSIGAALAQISETVTSETSRLPDLTQVFSGSQTRPLSELNRAHEESFAANLGKFEGERPETKTMKRASTFALMDEAERDLLVVSRIAKISRGIITNKKNHFEKSIARYCRAQEEHVPPPTLDEIRSVVKEQMEQEATEREAWVDEIVEQQLSTNEALLDLVARVGRLMDQQDPQPLIARQGAAKALVPQRGEEAVAWVRSKEVARGSMGVEMPRFRPGRRRQVPPLPGPVPAPLPVPSGIFF